MAETLVKIRERSDTASRWATFNPILLKNERGYETDTLKFKNGDGVTAWNDLAYRLAGTGEKGEKGEDGTSFTVDENGDLAGRDAFNTEAKGFSYLDTENGNLYIKNSATSGDWSNPIPFGKGEDGYSDAYAKLIGKDLVYDKLEVFRELEKTISSGVISSSGAYDILIVKLPIGSTVLYVNSAVSTGHTASAIFNGYPTSGGTYNPVALSFIKYSNVWQKTGFTATSDTYMVIRIGKASPTPVMETDNGYISVVPIKAHINGGDINQLTINESYELSELQRATINTKNKVNKQSIVDGYIDTTPNHNFIRHVGNQKILIIPVEYPKKYVFSSSTPLNQGAYYSLAFINEADEVLAFNAGNDAYRCDCVKTVNGGWKINSYPQSAKFIAIGLGSKTKNEIDDLRIQFEEGEVATDYSSRSKMPKPLQESKWFGKRYLAVGDSITSTSYGGTKKYAEFISSSFGMTTYNNVGVGGQKMTKVTGNGNEFSDGLYSDITWTDYDLVTIFLGTNDFSSSSTMGVINDITNSTFYGAWNVVLTHIFTENPLIRVVIISSIQRGTMNTPNSKGLLLKDYVDSVIKVSRKYSCPVINLFDNVGINEITLTTYLSDGTHPTDDGQKLMADYILNQIKNL